MLAAAVYARFSTEKQSDTSTDDQIRLCETRARAAGWPIVARHADQGISGSTPVESRSGGRALLADALAGRFRILLLEGLDRLSRDLVESERIVRRLEHRGIRIIGVADGYDSQSAARKLHRGMRGVMNEVYLDDLRHKTHRGLTGQVARGFHAGGLSYGYRSAVVDGGHRLEVDPQAAGWVRWIFRQYADGRSPQWIAHELNRLGVPAPRSGTWAVSAIYGSAVKGVGLLHNELYIGRYVWNRTQWLKDPDSGKRVRFDRPREEWQVTERPELRIVDDALWQAARARQSRPRTAGGTGPGRPPRTLFGGLLRCGLCGGAMVATDRRRYSCAAAKDRGRTVCTGVAVPRTELDDRVLSVLRDELLSPESLAELQRAIAATSRGQVKMARERERARAQRRAELEREIDNLVGAIATMGGSPALQERLQRAEAERQALDAAPALPPKVIEGPTAEHALRRYRERLLALRQALDADQALARRMIAELLGSLTITTRGEEIWATPETEKPALLMTGTGSPLNVVAGARFGGWRPIRIR
ncbi:MAG TPA: recombinase family protein [Burkholderiaceae bacterium]|nr:recombinase family protein [Burkholderiaceae bacterium]